MQSLMPAPSASGRLTLRPPAPRSRRPCEPETVLLMPKVQSVEGGNTARRLWKHPRIRGAENCRTRLPAGDPKAAVQIPYRRGKAHAVHCGMERREPSRACRQGVAERVVAGLSDAVLANEDLARVHTVCLCPTLHLRELCREVGRGSAGGIARNFGGELVLESGALILREVGILLDERQRVRQRGLRIVSIIRPGQAGQVAVPAIEQPGKPLAGKHERVVVMERE